MYVQKHEANRVRSPDLPTVVFIGPSLLWFSASWQFWQAWAAPFVNERESTPKIANPSDSNLIILLSLANGSPICGSR